VHHVSLEETVNLAILAGEVMLINGAETSRAEETMDHIAWACGASAVNSFVIPTGVFLTVSNMEGRSLTAMRRIKYRTIDLERIAKVNELSRRLVDYRIEFTEAQNLLNNIAQERAVLPAVISIGASGVIGGGYAVVQSGGSGEMVGGFIAASGVSWIASLVTGFHGGQFIYEFLGGLVAAFIGILLQNYYSELNRDVIIVAGLMPLVPGMVITNAIRDIIAGDLLSGISRGLEATLTAVAVAMGVVIALSFGK